MPRRTCTALLLTLVLLPVLGGCFYSREIAATQRAIARQNPGVHFDRQFTFSLGRGWLSTFAELAAFGKVDEAKLASDYLRSVRRVKVGVFELDGAVSPSLNLLAIPHFQSGGWQTLARVREKGGPSVAVLYRERFGEVRDLFVVALDDPSLVIVRVTGNFTEIVINAMADFANRLPELDWRIEKPESVPAEAE